MSLLSDKINSYAINGYCTLNYALSNAPLVVPNLGTLTLYSNNPAGLVNKIWEPTVTCVGGGGSWKINIGASGTGWGLSWQGANFTSVQNDGDFSMGLWIKFNGLPAGTGSTIHYGHSATAITNSQFNFAVTGSSHATTPSKWVLSAKGTSTTLSFGPTDGQWHYLAVTRKSDLVMKFYIDGVLVHTVTGVGTSANGNINHASPSGSGVAYSVNISDYYVAPTSAIDETQIAQIWSIGNTGSAARTVKYYDGTTWQTSSAQKVFNGTSWVDWTAKKYDGSQWVTI
jgi:hypothetical protein